MSFPSEPIAVYFTDVNRELCLDPFAVCSKRTSTHVTIWSRKYEFKPERSKTRFFFGAVPIDFSLMYTPCVH